MKLNSDKNPKEFLILLLSAGIKVFGNKNNLTNDEIINDAEDFINKIEQKFGKIEE